MISIGINQKKTHPLQARFCSNPERLYLHAETDAISRAIKVTNDFSKAYLYVGRSKFGAIPGMARSCNGCIDCAEHYGFKGIFYSTDTNDIGYLGLG